MIDSSSDLSAIGIGGILALLILREVFAFLRARKNGPNGNSTLALVKIADGMENLGTLAREQSGTLREIAVGIHDVLEEQRHQAATRDTIVSEMTRTLGRIEEGTKGRR